MDKELTAAQARREQLETLLERAEGAQATSEDLQKQVERAPCRRMEWRQGFPVAGLVYTPGLVLQSDRGPAWSFARDLDPCEIVVPPGVATARRRWKDSTGKQVYGGGSGGPAGEHEQARGREPHPQEERLLAR